MVVKRLDVARQVLVASPDLLIRQGTPTTLADSRRMDSISMSAPDGKAVWQPTAPPTVPSRRCSTPRYVADDLLTLKFAALSGTGICWLPDYMCHDEIRDRRLVRVLPDWAPTPSIVHAVFPSRRGLALRCGIFWTFWANPCRGAAAWRPVCQQGDEGPLAAGGSARRHRFAVTMQPIETKPVGCARTQLRPPGTQRRGFPP